MKPLVFLKRKVKGRCSTTFCKNSCTGTLCGTCRCRQSRLKDPVRYAYNNLKNRAKQRGIAFTITLDQFRDFCVKTAYISGKGVKKDGYTIDRIYNGVGYHIDNIQVMAKGDNIRKYFLTYDWEHKIASVYKKELPKTGTDEPF